MLNNASVASAGSYVRTCRRIRNSKKIATLRDFHQNICVNPTMWDMMLLNYVRLKGKQCLIGKSHRIDDEIQLFINIVFDAIRIKIEYGIKSC